MTGLLRCEGNALHAGSRLATAEGRIFDFEGRLVAHGSETCLISARHPATSTGSATGENPDSFAGSQKP